MSTIRVCPAEGCNSFTIDEPDLPCAIHGGDMVIERIEDDEVDA